MGSTSGCGDGWPFPIDIAPHTEADFPVLSPSQLGSNIRITDDPIRTAQSPPGGDLDLCVSGDKVYVAFVRWYPIPFPEGPLTKTLRFVKSVDGGATWGKNITLDQLEGAQQLWTPRMICDGNKVFLFWVRAAWYVPHQVYRAVSTDGGETFSQPEPVTFPTDAVFQNVVPKVLRLPTGEFLLFLRAKLDGISYLYVARSEDEGRSISTLAIPHDIPDSTLPAYPDSNLTVHQINITVAPDGTVYSALIVLDSPKSQIYLSKSTDGGRSFHVINDRIVDIQNFTPNLYVPLRVQVDDAGRVYIAWIDLYQKNWDQRRVMLSVSEDGGQLFRAPVRAYDIAFNEGPDAPRVRVYGSTVYVSWDSDGREDTGNPVTGNQRNLVMVAKSVDGGKTFLTPALRVNDKMPDTIMNDGWDHQTAIDSAGNLHFIWVDTRYWFMREQSYLGASNDIFYAKGRP